LSGPARFDDPVLTHFRKVLRESRLAETAGFLELADGAFTVGCNVAENRQTLVITHNLEDHGNTICISADMTQVSFDESGHLYPLRFAWARSSAFGIGMFVNQILDLLQLDRIAYAAQSALVR
jgi:hypothetical protein